MKRLLIISNLLLLGIIAYLVFFKVDTKTPKPEEPIARTPKGLISFDAAKLISHNYGDDKRKSTSEVIAPDGSTIIMNDTKSIWYDLNNLKEFIAGIEDAAKKVGCHKPLGVRLYVSKYPDVETMKKIPTLRDVPAEYANKLTFFLVPTISDGKSSRDFNPTIWTNCDAPPYYTQKGSMKRDNGPGAEKDTTDWIINHGDIIPPPYPGGEFPPDEQ